MAEARTSTGPRIGGEEPQDAASSAAVDYGRTAGFLSVGVGLTGIITYAYFAVASHILSKNAYGQIAVLWSAVFITISTLYRPTDQLLSRHISEHLARRQPISQPLRVAATIQLGVAALFAVATLAFRHLLQDRLLSGNETLYWIYFTAGIGYAASYFARGFLAGNRRFGLFSLLILSESIFRTSFAVIVAIGLASGQSVVALGIAAAPCLSLIVVPLAFASRAGAVPAQSVPAEGEGAAPEFSLARGTGFAAAVLLIMFSEQTFLNAGPLLIRATAGAAAAGFIFNVLMLARAPLQLFQAVSTSILPHLTGLHHSEEEGAAEAFRSSVRLVLAAIAAFTALVAVVVLVAGPELMQIAFGRKFTYDRLGLLIVAVGMGLYLSAVTVNQACLAQGQVRRASARWIGCAAFFIAWCLLPIIGNSFRRVEIGFTLTALGLLGLLLLIYRHPAERAADVIDPGSAQELEAQLAAADEGSP